MRKRQIAVAAVFGILVGGPLTLAFVLDAYMTRSWPMLALGVICGLATIAAVAAGLSEPSNE